MNRSEARELPRLPLERLGLAALALLTLTPPVAVGVGVPLAWAAGATLEANSLVLGAMVVGAVAALACAGARRARQATLSTSDLLISAGLAAPLGHLTDR